MNIHGAKRAGRCRRKACMGWSWAAACGVQGRDILRGFPHSLFKEKCSVCIHKMRRCTAVYIRNMSHLNLFCWVSVIWLHSFNVYSKSLRYIWKLLMLQYNWKHEKAIGETQTLRAGCSKAEPKIFAPPLTLFPGAQDDQN